jgi:hypothetical protein
MRGRSRERKVLRAVRLLADQFLDVVAREMRRRWRGGPISRTATAPARSAPSSRR